MVGTFEYKRNWYIDPKQKLCFRYNWFIPKINRPNQAENFLPVQTSIVLASYEYNYSFKIRNLFV